LGGFQKLFGWWGAVPQASAIKNGFGSVERRKTMNAYLLKVLFQKADALTRRFVREERADEIMEKAAVIGAMTVAVLVILGLAVLAAARLEEGAAWFG
jgi:hypothetical protein